MELSHVDKTYKNNQENIEKEKLKGLLPSQTLKYTSNATKWGWLINRQTKQ